MQAGPRKDEKTKKGGIVGWFSRVISREKGESKLPPLEEDEMVVLESKRKDKQKKEKKHASHKEGGEHTHKHKHKHDRNNGYFLLSSRHIDVDRCSFSRQCFIKAR